MQSSQVLLFYCIHVGLHIELMLYLLLLPSDVNIPQLLQNLQRLLVLPQFLLLRVAMRIGGDRKRKFNRLLSKG